MCNENKNIATRDGTEMSNEASFSPDQVIRNAASIATSLANIINQKKLYTVIQGNKYVHATGWGIMMAMNRVSPCVINSIKLEREDEIAYESEVELLSHDNRVIGRASAICSSKEPSKRGQPEYVIKSMAQTRATSKAARLSFAWIMQLAGYEATPANEMEDVIIKESPKKTIRPAIDSIASVSGSNKEKGDMVQPSVSKINICSSFINTKSTLAKVAASKSLDSLEEAYKESCSLGLDKESREKVINACAQRKKEIIESEKEMLEDVPQ